MFLQWSPDWHPVDGNKPFAPFALSVVEETLQGTTMSVVVHVIEIIRSDPEDLPTLGPLSHHVPKIRLFKEIARSPRYPLAYYSGGYVHHRYRSVVRARGEEPPSRHPRRRRAQYGSCHETKKPHQNVYTPACQEVRPRRDRENPGRRL